MSSNEKIELIFWLLFFGSVLEGQVLRFDNTLRTAEAQMEDSPISYNFLQIISLGRAIIIDSLDSETYSVDSTFLLFRK
jgi:hypothetical protein